MICLLIDDLCVDCWLLIVDATYWVVVLAFKNVQIRFQIAMSIRTQKFKCKLLGKTNWKISIPKIIEFG